MPAAGKRTALSDKDSNSIPEGSEQEIVERMAVHMAAIMRELNLDLEDPNFTETPERVAKAYVELYESNGIEHAFRTYQVVMGPDLPAYLIVESADNEADYWAAMSEVQELVGEEGKALSQEGMQYMRRLEINSGWVRADLSYLPPE